MAKEEKRLIGEYKVINSMFIGSKEVALCENLKDPHGLYYMTCDVHNNDFYEFYNLGMGDPIPISAGQKTGIGDLLEAGELAVCIDTAGSGDGINGLAELGEIVHVHIVTLLGALKSHGVGAVTGTKNCNFHKLISFYPK